MGCTSTEGGAPISTPYIDLSVPFVEVSSVIAPTFDAALDRPQNMVSGIVMHSMCMSVCLPWL